MEEVEGSGSLDHHKGEGQPCGKTGSTANTGHVPSCTVLFWHDRNSAFGQSEAWVLEACLLEFTWQDFLPVFIAD